MIKSTSRLLFPTTMALWLCLSLSVTATFLFLPIEADTEGSVSPVLRAEVERDILTALFQYTNGDDWARNDGWGDPQIHYCEWQGVTCLSPGSTGRALQFQQQSDNDAATVDSILDGDLIEEAAEAGLRSIFVGFESLDPRNLKQSNKTQNLKRDYQQVTQRLHDLGIMINGSFVFGLDGDDSSVFDRTVDWAVSSGITTATFHIATPYPGTAFYQAMQSAGRMTTNNWDMFDTRTVTFRPASMTPEDLKRGYDQAYQDFYTWRSILKASVFHGSLKHQLKHFFYASGWKKFEPLWNMVIQLKRLNVMTPVLEAVLSRVTRTTRDARNGTRDVSHAT